MKRISSDIEKEICKLYNSNGYELSKKFNIEVHTVYKILKRNGINPSCRKLTSEQESKIIELYIQGKDGYTIASIMNIRYNLVYYTLKRNKIKTRSMSEIKRIYKVNENCFDEIDCEWKSYFLGLFYADGCLTKHSAKISLVSDDKHILETLNKFIHINRPLYSIPKKLFKSPTNNKEYIGRPQTRLEINNQKINIRLRQLGLYERKSLTLNFPTAEMIPNNLMKHFIRGYFDGDGCIYNRKWGQRFDINSSFDFCNSLYQWLYINLQINSKVSPHSSIYRLSVNNKKDISTIYHFLYDNSSIFLNRKFIKFKSIVENFDWTKINKTPYSKFKYVTYDKRRNRWMVNKKSNGKSKFYGSFMSEMDASKVSLAIQ